MRHFHKLKNHSHNPIINLDKLWTLVGEEARRRLGSAPAACRRARAAPRRLRLTMRAFFTRTAAVAPAQRDGRSKNCLLAKPCSQLSRPVVLQARLSAEKDKAKALVINVLDHGFFKVFIFSATFFLTQLMPRLHGCLSTSIFAFI